MDKQFIGGHIYDGNIASLKFVFDALTITEEGWAKTPIENGEILISEESFSQEKYFLRVNDIKYGGNSSWALEMGREHNLYEKKKDFSDEHENPEELFQPQREEQRFNIAECEILGISKTNGFFTVRTIPSVFSRVRKLIPEDFNGPLKETMGDLKIGHLRSGSQVLDLEAGIFKKSLSTHTFITARTGGGKSNTMKVLNGVMLESKGEVSPLIFEPHGEYITDLKRHPLQKERLVIYNQDNQVSRSGDKKLRISYKRVTVDSLMNLRRQMNWTEPQERYLSLAQSVFKEKWFQTLVETPYDEEDYYAMYGRPYSDEEFDLQDFVSSQLSKSPSSPTLLRDMLRTGVHIEAVKAAISKLKRIARAPFLVKEENQDELTNIINHLMSGKGVLIDMDGLNELQELYLSSLLTSEVLDRQKKLYKKDREGMENGKYPVIAIVLEECQRVLGKNDHSDANIFRTVVNEGRKYLVGLIGITQQAKLMDPVVLSQMNTHIILGISDETDFDLLKGRVQKSIKNLEMDINQLMPGEAIISSPNSPFALPIKIFEYNNYIEKLKKNLPSSLKNKNDFSLFH
ncbi:ATP-binding protein [Bacillus mexicanus]|uniref:ATP-binding protein n=1 Tax=Bacillus mexicanus TaxID=2834415 RepID=UPI003D2232B4